MSPELWGAIGEACLETLYMVFVAGGLATVFGLPLGVILLVTRRGHLLPRPKVNAVLGAIVNAARSVPFIILLIALVPLTHALVGTSIGTTAAIVPLTLGAIPFIARLIENALLEVDAGLIEAGQAMGASYWQLIRKVIIPEGFSGILNAITVTLVTLVGYSAMAGAVGGGGLGDLAIRYGYQRFNVMVMLITVAILIVFVQGIQMVGDRVAKRNKK